MLESLYAAVAALAGAIVVIWRVMERHHAECVADRRRLWDHLLEKGRIL